MKSPAATPVGNSGGVWSFWRKTHERKSAQVGKQRAARDNAGSRVLVPFPVHEFRGRRSVVQISFLTADGTGDSKRCSFAAKMKFEGLTSVFTTAHFMLFPRNS
jgi:hypothetical protein